MRKLVLTVGLVGLCANVALAQGKVSNGWACSKPSVMHSLEVGDEPNHVYMIDQFKCTSTKGEVAGIKEKEGAGTEFSEMRGDRAIGHGFFTETLTNGDKITVSYEFTGTVKNGQMVSGSNKWYATSGTGKFKGIKYTGSCTGKGNPDGSSSYTCSGTYSTPSK